MNAKFAFSKTPCLLYNNVNGECLGNFACINDAVEIAYARKLSIFRICSGTKTLRCCIGKALHPFQALFTLGGIYVLIVYRLLLKSKALFVKGQSYPIPADSFDVVFDENKHQVAYCRNLDLEEEK